MAKSIGIVKIIIDGKLLHTKPGATLDPGGPVRTAVETDQPGIFSESRRPSKIECEVVVTKDYNTDELRNADDFTAKFLSDTGQTWVVNHAYVTEPPVITGGNNGGAKLIIEGPPAQEVKAA